MHSLFPFCVLVGFGFIAHMLCMVIPFPIPEAVIAMLLVFAALLTKIFPEDKLQRTGDFLLANLSICFLPAIVQLMSYADLLKDIWFPFFVVCILSTVVTFVVTIGAVSLTLRLMDKKGGIQS